MSTILYLHGFLSSPSSIKAQQTKQYFESIGIDVIVPSLPNLPSKISSYLLNVLDEYPDIVAQGLKVIGSSMGGFLATWLVERIGGRAVLINPAVQPYQLLNDYLGHHINPYTKEKFELVANDIEVLKSMDHIHLQSQANYKVLLQTGDETLDYRQAVNKYLNSDVTIEEGGDHSFIDYQKHLDSISKFLYQKK